MALIDIKEKTRTELRKYKAEEGDTYDQAIKRLLKNDGWEVADTDE